MQPRLHAEPPPVTTAIPGRPPALVTTLLVLWPAFVMAGVLEMLVFAAVDPASLQWFGGDAARWSNTAIYSATFLGFWAVIATSTAITLWLSLSWPGEDANAGPAAAHRLSDGL